MDDKTEDVMTMLAILLVLLVVLALGGAGFVLHALWIAAVVVLALWLLGFVVRSAEGIGGRGRARWYRW